MQPLKIFIGYDTRETIAYHVLVHSILARTSTIVSITPLVKSALVSSGLYTRPRLAVESTDFSLTRFLVPYLADFRGIAIYMDCDMLCLSDIGNLVNYVHDDPFRTLFVCKHDYQPKTTHKMDGRVQTTYPRKNWSSLMVFNLQNMGARKLTSKYVNDASPSDLHQFAWTDDSKIGELPLEWNWLVDEYPVTNRANILHYTLGGPWLGVKSGMDEPWLNELAAMEGVSGN